MKIILTNWRVYIVVGMADEIETIGAGKWKFIDVTI